MKTLLLLLISLLFVICSCQKEKSEPENCLDCIKTDLSDTVNHELENKWILLGFNYLNQSVECVPEKIKEMNIEFLESNRFRAASSCNGIIGYYKVIEPDIIYLDSIIITSMYCLDAEVMDWENKYFHGLAKASKFIITCNQLTISTSDNSKLKFVVN
ncbi:MAG: META domain-containing protein [Bacteroidales bacterium]|nr:META domain-containing protein [Bacteroidales bacterium]